MVSVLVVKLVSQGVQEIPLLASELLCPEQDALVCEAGAGGSERDPFVGRHELGSRISSVVCWKSSTVTAILQGRPQLVSCQMLSSSVKLPGFCSPPCCSK
jgi:hypothetical protein